MAYHQHMDLYEIFGRDQERDKENTDPNIQKKPESRCTICLCRIEKDHIQTPCGHDFHKSCLEKAYLTTGNCPNCRQHIPKRWLHTNRIAIRMTSTEYWQHVNDTLLPPPPVIGPMLPGHQRLYDFQCNTSITPPSPWTRLWIQDRIVEMRVRFNIPTDYVLTTVDVQTCEENGIMGITPEWSFPTWVHPDSD